MRLTDLSVPLLGEAPPTIVKVIVPEDATLGSTVIVPVISAPSAPKESGLKSACAGPEVVLSCMDAACPGPEIGLICTLVCAGEITRAC